MKPAILRECGLGRLIILVISGENHIALHEKFTCNILGINGINADFNMLTHVFSHRLQFISVRFADAYERGTFRHAISGSERRFQFHRQKLLYLVRNCGTAGYEFLDSATHSFHENGPERSAEIRILLIVLKFRPS